ncbi:hypothetical protein CFK41_12945 [Brachybacterium ginsengisoli]|uniref:DUF4031 domain-containing protein n=1 Tax=Brachybacterium ginsengisoli TaxID=1331682 RepID=A0A291GZE4_9MICO|nr:DUF4031 domain-containing protein [Brachybacterium ginsengisoli]ATG55575.1 hypothetical protein CFK41_12945 [Brachybacterium ginsengisoli]
MTVHADTPRWPRHGMLWGHLISDTSLEELHEVAARAGLPPRSFDLDHYDWPTAARESLEQAGVHFVSDGELTRLLIGSGLRIKLRDRPAARARRSAEHAAELGLEPVPRDLLVGLRGHVDPLPEEPGAFRLTRDVPAGEARIEAHDRAGHRAAAAMLDRLDALSRARTGSGFVGQVMDAPTPGI